MSASNLPAGPLPLPWKFDDGGRSAAGWSGITTDCVCRAVAIATRLPYQDVYDRINTLGATERGSHKRRGKSTARTGVYKATTRRLISALGWTWTPTMHIGSGCTVHLRVGELPMGRLIVSVSRHIVAVIDGVVFDTFDPTRGGMRCVYGYWQAAS